MMSEVSHRETDICYTPPGSPLCAYEIVTFEPLAGGSMSYKTISLKEEEPGNEGDVLDWEQ